MRFLKYILAFLLVATPLFAQEGMPQAPDVEDKELAFVFDGAWLPDNDPAEIGPKNYKELKNLRYGPSEIGLEGVRGYTKINTTALTTYTKIRTGHQLKTDRSTGSYVLVQAENSGETASRVFVNSTAIPSQGDFSSTIELDSGNAYRDDTTGAGAGRFSSAPLGSLTYTNGVESLIWSGEEMRVGAFITMAHSAPYNSVAYPIDSTNAVNNELSTTGNTVAIGAGARDYFLIMTTRPIQAVYFDVTSVNAAAAVLDIHYWKSDATWAALAESDGTLVAGATLAQDGWVTWDHVTDAAPYHYQGNYMYAYRFGVNAATATIKYVTVNSPMQAIVDLWDGIPRQPIQFKIWRNAESKFKDWTLEVNEASYEALPFVAQLDAMVAADYIIIMSEDRLSGVMLNFMAGWVNTAATAPTVYYWDGDSYATVGTVTDGTALSGASFGQNGLLWWTPPAETSEFQKEEFGVTGYSYKISFNNTLSGTYVDESDIMSETGDVALDFVTLTTAQLMVNAFSFPSQYKDRVLLCGYIEGKQGNRCDYSQTGSTEIWNGADSSDNGVQSLYFGGSEPLTAGAEIYNRYGSQVITMWTAFKNGETYVLKGDDPESFTISRVSKNVGCPSPCLTLTNAEVAFEVAPDVRRNMLFWLSDSGPYSFDGQVLAPVKGVDKYFDPDNDEAINFDEIGRARGFYDSSKREWNLLIPSGSAQTTNNVWLVYDIIKKKWFRKDTGAASFPQVGFSVQDSYGVKYSYGGIDSGFMMRLENGNSWNGTGIEQVVETGDFWPTGNIWDLTRIRQLKVMAKRIPEAYKLNIQHFADTDDSLGLSGVWQNWDGGQWEDWEGGEWVNASLVSVALSLSDSINRIARDTVVDNLYGWSHRFRFSMTTDDVTKGLQPLGWGFVFQKVPHRDE